MFICSFIFFKILILACEARASMAGVGTWLRRLSVSPSVTISSTWAPVTQEARRGITVTGNSVIVIIFIHLG